VLITGETGTGKELIARAIHANSLRRSHPLIKINCAALPTELIESELFGHQKGAFTGALANKPGRFELANGGTLFLDEIGDIPIESQAKLLRALQEQEFERVGGNKTIKIDVRVIAATNRVLVNRIATGEFREDLFYRLNVFPIHSAPLRDRSSDIETLAYHFLKKYSKKIGKPIDVIDDRVMARLVDYHWPGNVRELENIIERAIILSEGHRLQLDEAFDLNVAPEKTEMKTLGEVEQEMIQSALKDCAWKIEGDSGAATRLAMAPSTLRERIKNYGLERYGSDTVTATDPVQID
jgi:transcriptional regulator with GAF, ATPase, and Fis domain